MENKVAYTVADIAALMGFSTRAVTRMFERERGVMILERPERLHKCRYRSLRIPRVVFERVIRRMTVR
jgi:transcriptional regulator GlxA family with amidase domain